MKRWCRNAKNTLCYKEKKKVNYLLHMNKLNGVSLNTNIFPSILFPSPISKKEAHFFLERIPVKTLGYTE